MQRRSLLQAASAIGLLGLGACATTGRAPSKARVLVVGGGYGGATAAKYVRLLSDHKIDVVLVEPNDAFVSCPVSNLVLGGSKTLADITTPYDGLARTHGVQVVKDMVASIDVAKKEMFPPDDEPTGLKLNFDDLHMNPNATYIPR